jgi:hypothetical protein
MMISRPCECRAVGRWKMVFCSEVDVVEDPVDLLHVNIPQISDASRIVAQGRIK